VATPDEPSEVAGTLDEILRRDLVRSVFQPIVDLETEAVLGFEALARGPEDSALQRPDRLFAAAAAGDRLAELDRACQRAALSGARANELGPPLTLFVNVEPDAIGEASLPAPGPGLRAVIEVTERALTARPAELLRTVTRARVEGWGLALDDVGADTRSLALMPLLRPDVIKLDLRLVHENPTPEIAAIVGAVGAQAERTGATVLAEGIETERQTEHARALGATLGQGFLFGRPSAEPDRTAVADVALPIFTGALPYAARTPFELASARRPVRRGDQRLLLAISRELELQASRRRGTSLVISTFQHLERFTPRTQSIYEELASELAFVAVLAADMPPEPAPGVRGAPISADDPLLGSWCVVVIGAHFASMLAAEERGEAELEEDRRFDFVFTYDRELIVVCAQALTLRISG